MKNHTHKEPLYRKVNTTARGVHHDFGSDFRHDRNTKQTKDAIDAGATRGTMGKTKDRGLDYTPLYRFLLSKVGAEWSAVHSEAVARLDKDEAIYHMVARNDAEKVDTARLGESSYYSGLFVDEDNILQKVNPLADHSAVNVSCACCTFTFNGVKVPQKYKDEPSMQM
jgi:hypothetical protein